VKLCHILIALITACVSPISLGATKKPVTFGVHEFQGRCFGYFRATDKYIDLYNLYLNCPRMRITSHRNFDEIISEQPFITDLYKIHPADITKSCPFHIFAVSVNTSLEYPVPIEVSAYRTSSDYKNRESLTDYFACGANAMGSYKPQIFAPQGPHGRSKAEQRRILAQFEREEREARRRQSKRPTASPAH
jgi:hypothetical protein